MSSIPFCFLGPATVTSSSMQLVDSVVPIASFNGYVGIDSIALNNFRWYEIKAFAIHAAAEGCYSEVWMATCAVQRITGPNYRVGTVTKTSLNNSSAYSVLDSATPINVDVAGGNLCLFARAGSTFGSARVWGFIERVWDSY